MYITSHHIYIQYVEYQKPFNQTQKKQKKKQKLKKNIEETIFTALAMTLPHLAYNCHIYGPSALLQCS